VDFVNAFILAVVEGITEFLPISSTGHLILVESFLSLGNDKDFTETFIVIIQFPAILSVCLYFWRQLWPLRDGKLDRDIVSLWMKVAVAFLPAAVLGLLLDDFIESLFDNAVVAVTLILGGIVLIAIERREHEAKTDSIGALSYKQAIGIGLIQCLAMIPGTSRSGATIIGGLLLGASRSVAAEFSFFLAIPTMVGATSLKLMKNGLDFSGHQWALIALGSIVSFVVAYGVIAFLMAFIKKHSFSVFGIYRIILGIVVLVVLKMV
jgi:undecaprenyl-diphosphatase